MIGTLMGFAFRDGAWRLDLLTAYGVSGARVGSWIVVTAIIFPISPPAYALLVLIRTTLGLLNYTALGLGPAMVHRLAGALPPHAENRRADAGSAWRAIYRNGLLAGLLAAGAGTILVAGYGAGFDWLFDRPAGNIGSVALAVWCVGGGMVLRLGSDVPGAALQTAGRITLDNLLQITAELIWVGLAFIPAPEHQPLLWIALGLPIGAAGLLTMRLIAAAWIAGAGSAPPSTDSSGVSWATIRALLSYGLLVTVASLSDYLYAPTDIYLINRLIDPLAVAVYAPAVQIDAALLVMVSAVAGVVLPRTAVAFAAGRTAQVRRMYLLGTALTAGVLLVGAIAVMLTAPTLFRIWLKNPMPATQAILPLVLIHTVAGGSSAIGRAVLLAIGKVRAFTLAALVAGAANVGLSFCLVYFGQMGLRGVVLGTIVAVLGRCVFWMPWYILRVTARLAPSQTPIAPARV